MAKNLVLIVEDDRSIADVLVYNLRQSGYAVAVASDGQDALNQVQNKRPQLIILDLMLPVIDGLEVCRRLRANPASRDVPIMMLTAKAEETDQVVGLAMGADDYVTKPFSIQVVLQRVKALLRRTAVSSEDRSVASSQGVTVDRQRHVATAGGRVLELTPSEFSLLDTLVRQPGRAFSRGDLITAALGDTIVLERTIDVHIRALRKKMGGYAGLVQTVRGIGYRFRDPTISDPP